MTKCPKCNSMTRYERLRFSSKRLDEFFSCDCGCTWVQWQQELILKQQEEITNLQQTIADRECQLIAARREKDARIYYQNIVYAVCNVLDKINSNRIVSGTLETPSTEVQDTILGGNDVLENNTT